MRDSVTAGSRRIELFAAISTGCLALSRHVGLSLVCIGASSDPDGAIATMNAKRHAGMVATDAPCGPFALEEGWDDWRIVPFRPDHGLDMPAVMELSDGRIAFDLSGDVTTARFQDELFGTMRRIGLDAIVKAPAWLQFRHGAATAQRIPPRYSSPVAQGDGRDVELVEDLFALDPGRHASVVAWLAMEACKKAAPLSARGFHHVR